MKLRRRAEATCSRCGSEVWTAGKVETCAGCGKARSISNWSYTRAGRERSTGTKVRARAEQIAARERTRYAEEGPRALRLPKTIPTLAQFSKQFLEFVDASEDLKPNTKRCYRNGWRLLGKTAIASMRLSDIGPADVSVIKFPGSGSNANQAIRTLSRMLTLASQGDYIKVTPRFRLRKERRRTAVIEGWLEDVLLEMATPTLHDFLVIMLDCGMRPEEVARMRWEHVLWGDKAVLVPYGKTDQAERHVPLSERMAGLLRARRNGSEWVFPARITKAGKPVSASGHVSPTAVGGKMWNALKAAYSAASPKRKLPEMPDDLVLYSARHTFATRFLKASGNDRAALKEIMGHSSFSVTERYVHGGIAEAAAVMDEYNKDRRTLALVGKRA